jgi:hypothetical protein
MPKRRKSDPVTKKPKKPARPRNEPDLRKGEEGANAFTNAMRQILHPLPPKKP